MPQRVQGQGMVLGKPGVTQGLQALTYDQAYLLLILYSL